ncbi:MAG: mechanosensitive ion channel domain-containing protein, partial [Pseudomonadota bacterium]
MDVDNLQQYVDLVVEMAISYGPKLILAIIVLFVGLWVIGTLASLFNAILVRQKVDETLIPFLTNLVSWGLKALLAISVASMVGVETTSFVAVIGAAGLAVGLALQGSLANFAGGVLILIFSPFKKGDYISAQGHEGVVESIDIFATIIVTLDNRKIVIPNGPLAGGTIDNYTGESVRRVDLAIGISYNDDIKQACKTLQDMCSRHTKVIDKPEAPFVGVTDYGDSSINLTVRAWCKTEDYWTVFFDLNTEIKYALDAGGFSIP